MESRLVLSDTHLSPEQGRSTGADLARLLADFRGSEIILAGDIFDLSLEAAEAPVAAGVARALGAHPEFRGELTAHVQKGGRLTLVPGNHDAALNNAEGIQALRQAIGTPDDRQVQVSRWFARRGGVHVEHGHLYDADNSFAHALADHDPRTEPLGTALMRRFVAPNDAHFFAHAHRTTPASGFKTAFEKWGPRAPVVIARYFMTAFGLCGDAAFGKGARRAERQLGEARIVSRALELELEPEILRALSRLATEPTHESFRRTFLRLYFDRIFSALSVATGASLIAAAGLGTGGLAGAGAGALVAAVGGSYLLHNVRRKQNRYGGTIVEEVGHAADLVRQASGAELVVFGHTHVPVQRPGYINLGSFGYGRPERPYLLLDGQGKPTVGRFARN